MNRSATEDDAEAVMSIVNRAYLVVKGDSGLAYATANTDRYNDLKQCERDTPHIILGTLDTGTIVCCGKGLVDKDCVHIGPLAVDPCYQGRGFGTQLLEALESLAAHQELSVVSCRTDVLKVYHRRGYVITKTLPVTDVIPLERLTRPDLKIQVMKKVNAMSQNIS